MQVRSMGPISETDMVSEIDVEGKLIIRQDGVIFLDHSHFEQTNDFLSPPHPENKHAIPLAWKQFSMPILPSSTSRRTARHGTGAQ